MSTQTFGSQRRRAVPCCGRLSWLRGPTIITAECLERRVNHAERRDYAWVLVPLLIFGLSRLAGWVLISIGSHRQVELVAQHNDPLFIFRGMPADPGYLGVITNWDGQWYQSIAIEGYQVPSQDDPARDRLMWTWGFPPLFPFTVRAVMFITQSPYGISASIVSITAGAIGMVLLYRLLRDTGGPFLAIAGVSLSSFFVSAPLFQAAYSESLAFLLLMAFFTLLRQRRYGWAFVVVLALSLTRIITLPLAAVVAVHAWGRFRPAEDDPPPRPRDAVALVSLGAACLGGTLAWLTIASLWIGADRGLARTTSQRDLYLGWFSDTLRFFGIPGFVFFVSLTVFIVLYGTSRFSRGWGRDLRTWSAAYPIYIFAISPIMPGTLRYLLLAPTLPLIVFGSPAKASWLRVMVLVLVCAAALAGQWWLVNELLVVSSLNQRFSP